jgi:hypothetical protein
MTADPLTLEDRALYVAFFEAYKEKFLELSAAAGGDEISLDACTVHAVKAMVARETAPRIVEAVGVGVRVRHDEEDGA